MRFKLSTLAWIVVLAAIELAIVREPSLVAVVWPFNWSTWLVVSLVAAFSALAGWNMSPTKRSGRLVPLAIICFTFYVVLCFYYLYLIMMLNSNTKLSMSLQDPLLCLERWYDRRFPLRTPGSIKLHGEWPRVQWLIRGHLELFGGLAGYRLAGLARWIREDRRASAQSSAGRVVGRGVG